MNTREQMDAYRYHEYLELKRAGIAGNIGRSAIDNAEDVLMGTFTLGLGIRERVASERPAPVAEQAPPELRRSFGSVMLRDIQRPAAIPPITADRLSVGYAEKPTSQ